MSRSARAHLAGMVAGFTLWAIAFVVIYGVQATGCVQGWDQARIVGLSALRLGLALLFLATLVGLAVVRPVPGRGSLLHGSLLGTVARACHLAATVATLVIFGAVLILPLC